MVKIKARQSSQYIQRQLIEALNIETQGRSRGGCGLAQSEAQRTSMITSTRAG